jgi:hypothetical protein
MAMKVLLRGGDDGTETGWWLFSSLSEAGRVIAIRRG